MQLQLFSSLVRKTLTLCFILATNFCYGQIVNNSFTYGNGINQQLPLFKCESTLGLFVEWAGAQNNDTLVLYFPNSFEVTNLPNNSILSDSTNGFIEIQIPTFGMAGNLTLDFTFSNCINSNASANSLLNSNNLQFGSYLINPLSGIDLQTYSYNGTPLSISPGNPSYATFTSSSPAFVITPTTNGQSFLGDANEIYSRRFNIQVNSPVIDSFLISINQELDLEHLELRLIDNNSSNGISPNVILNNDTGTSFIQSYIDLQSFSNYFITNNTTRTLTFEQVGRLKCFEPNVSTLVGISRDCCPDNFNYSANLNGRIDFGQTFVNSTNQVIKANSTIENGCSGAYYYDIKFIKSGPVSLIENITIPLNGQTISSIDSVFLIDIGNQIHSINPNNYTINTALFNNLFLNIDLINEYDSLVNWMGFQNYATIDTVNQDTSYVPTFGPWLDTTSFTIRIRFQYDCTSQQECESNLFSFVGRGIYHEDFPFPHNPNTAIQLTDSTFSADYLLSIRWWNSCEVDTISRFIHLNAPQPNFAPYVDGFVEMDHEMPEHDAVVYTFYPNGINPFNLLGPNSALSCDTSVSYRAKFFIPLPEEAADSVNRVQFSIDGLSVGTSNIPIDSSTFVNDSLLFIPLGQNINPTLPIHFSFDYVLTDCPFPDPPNSGGIQLMLEIQAYCDHCEDCYKTIACNALNVVVHCDGDCEGQVPMGTKSVEMERSTFGFAQESDFPSSPFTDRHEFLAHIDSNSINVGLSQDQLEIIHRNELSKLYPFDLVKLHSEGTITSYSNLTSSTGEPFEFNKIAFELAHTPIGNQGLFALKKASLTFVDSTNLDSAFTVSPLIIQNINPQNTEVFGMSGDTLYSFEIAIPNISDYPQLSDTNFAYTLHLDAEFWTLPDAASPINPIVVRGQFICSTNVDSLITTYSCDPWGSLLRVLIPSTEITLETEPDSISHCASNSKIKISVGGGLGTYVDDFDYEFRPIIAYGDTAFSENILSAYSTHNLTDTIFYTDSSGYFWNPNTWFLRPIEKPDSQQIYLSGRKFCASGLDTIPYSVPVYDFAYLTYQHQIDSLFSPLYLIGDSAIDLTAYSFYDSVNTTSTTQSDIQAVGSLPWIYSSTNIYNGLFVGLPNINQIQGIADSSLVRYDLHLKAPDSLQMGNCWLSYKFSKFIANAPSIALTTVPYSDTLNYLSDSLALDTLGETYHFFDNGFPLDSLSTTMLMPVECDIQSYQLRLRYGCFCDSASYAHFKIHPDSLPSCIADSSTIRFQHKDPYVDTHSDITVSNDSSGCALTWHIDVENPTDRPNLSQGKLLINIPSGLVLDTDNSTFSYYAQGDSILSSTGNYLNDTIPPNYTFQFEDFPTPPTTVLVLAFPSVNTLHAGSRLTFDLQFNLDQSTCSLDSTIFQISFLQRILEARFVGYGICAASNLYVSDDIQQTFIDNSINPSLQSQITAMTNSESCCLPSAVTVSINHTCSDSTLGMINFHFSSADGDNLVQLYQINSITNQYDSLFNDVINDTLYSFHLAPGLYSATVKTSGGLIYVFNSLVIQNHQVNADILVTQNSLCGGSPVILTAVDSNVANNFGFNASNPFIATDTLTSPALHFQWLNSDVTVDSLDNSIATASPLSDTTYQVIISHLSGCRDTAQVAISIHELLNEYSLNVNPTICNNQLINIEILPHSDSIGNYRLYLYNSDSSVVDTLQSLQLQASNYPSGTYFLELNYLNDSSCIEKNIAIIKIDSIYCTCNCSDDSLAVQVYIPSNIVSGDSLQTFIEGIEYPVSCYVISNNIIVDNSISLSNVSLKFKAGTELLIENSGIVYFNNVELSGCDTLWKGINNFGTLKYNIGSISDAQFGIFAQRQNGLPQLPNTTLKSITFKNNFIGLNIENQSGSHGLKLTSCSFIGGQLLPDYDQQSPPTISVGGLAGIKVEGFSLNIPSGTVFSGLDNGIYARRSKIVATKPYFLNIQPYANYSNTQYGLQSIKSAAINAVVGSDVYLYGAGTDEDINTPYIFEGCQYGAYTFKSYLNMTNCKIGATDNNYPSFVGVLSEGSYNYKGFYIHDNRIRSYGVGIGVFMANSLNHKYGDIVNNNIAIVSTFDSSQTDLSSGFQETGIMVNTFVDGGKIIIDSNLVSLRSATSTYSHGIYALNTKGLYVINNQIFRQTVNHGVGVQVTNSPYAQVLCNQSEAVDTTQESYSFQIDACPYVNIQNNQSDNSKYGFNFNLNNIGSRIAKNTIRTHGKYGLWIGVNGTVGQQPHRWNRWLSNAATEIQAYRQNDTSAAGNNIFLAEFGVTDPNFDYYPPVHDPIFFPCFLDNFFQCATDNESVEAVDCFASGSTIQGIIIDNGWDEENAIKIADKLAKEQVEYELYEDETIYSLKKSIDAMQQDSTLFLPDTASFPTFKSGIASTNIPKLNQVNENLRRIELDTALSQNLDALKSLILNKNLELFVLDSLLLSDMEQNSLSESLLSQRELLEDSIDYLDNEMQLMLSNIESIRMSNVNSANSKNDSVSAENDLESYERTINAIYLETIEHDIFKFNNSQKQSIEYIAGLCPLIGGEAVFKARSLLSLYNFNFIFDDHNLCLQQGLQYRISKQDDHAQVLKTALKVYPNPTSRSVTVDLQSELEGPFNLKILSLTGQTVYQLNSTLNKNTIDLESVNLSQGIYLVELRHELTNQTFRTRFVYGN